MSKIKKILIYIIGIGALVSGIYPVISQYLGIEVTNQEYAHSFRWDTTDLVEEYDLEDIPEYRGENYVELNGNQPFFSKEERKSKRDMEYYSPLDRLGRCHSAMATVGKGTLPTEPRGDIGSVHPSGWHTVNYHDLVDGNYLYNRCHLLAYQLTGENDNTSNLITGTRWMNVEGMIPFEDQVADYVKGKGGHVAYRVTPVYKGKDLVAQGVIMEAYSVEDDGKEVCYCVFVYNIQPGIEIDYTTGESRIAPQ